MPLRPETRIAINNAPRDTTAIVGPSSDLAGVTELHTVVRSTLDQAGNLQAEWSPDDGASWLAIGAAQSIAASSGLSSFDGTAASGGNLAGAMRLRDGLIRFRFTPGLPPTAGVIAVYLFRVYA